MTSTMTIEMPAELKQALGRAADEQGTTLESLVVETLRERYLKERGEENRASGRRSLADRLAPYIGVLDSGESIPGGARMSERTGEQYAKLLMRHHREGRP